MSRPPLGWRESLADAIDLDYPGDEAPGWSAMLTRTREIVGELERTRAERDAYKRAKAENDERYMLERDEARAEVARLRAELAEALATLANERGEGKPPEEGWQVIRNPMLPGHGRGWWWEREFVMVHRTESGEWTRNEYMRGEGVVIRDGYPTARAAMRAASAAAKGGEK